MKKIIIILLSLLVQLQSFVLLAYADQNTATPSATASAPSVLQSLGDSPIVTDSSQSQVATQLSDSLDTTNDTGLASSQIRVPIVQTLAQKTFQFKDHVVVSVYQGLASDITVKLFDHKGSEVNPATSITDSNGNVEVSLTPPDAFMPGKYSLKVYEGSSLLSTQDFTWGVLAVNTDKSIYAPNETAHIAIGVLDEQGSVVCDAKVRLVIVDSSKNPTTLSTDNGKIIVNNACHSTDMTLTPDYQAEYTVGQSGTYQMTLTATTKNGDYVINDSFVVQNNVPFDLSRIAPTRLYPANTYPVILSGVANEDFTGKVTERVPANFTVSRITNNPTVQGYDTITTRTTIKPQLPDSTSVSQPFADTYPVILGFGEKITNQALNEWYIKNGLLQNDGVDFALPGSTPILSVDDGTVVQTTPDGIYGTTLVIQHTWGKTYYGYLSSIEVVPGQKVTKGQEVALSGASGLASQPELHFAVKPMRNDPNNGFFGKVDPSNLLGLSDSSSVLSFTTRDSVSVQVLSWNISVKKGQKFQLGYQFQSPFVSPEFYTIGPARFFDTNNTIVFAEARTWQLAVDTGSSYQMKTGYYVGNTNPVHIAGLGFKPQLVIIKSDASTAGAVFSTTLMPGPNTAYFIATADNTAGMVNLETDGFTVSSTMSTANVRYTWIAFTGADCSSSGMFCIGSYAGTGSGNQSVTSVGFQPDLVWVKQSTAVAGNWRSSSMSANEGEYFTATTEDTTGVLFTTLDATGFTVGTTNNAAGNYYFVAFKNTSGYVSVGTYSGTGSAHGITGVGFQPSWIFAKNANAGTAQAAIYNVDESYGDNSSLFTATANTTSAITSLDSDGFHIGTNTAANGSGNTIFYAAFGGANANAGGDGSDFKMESGTYTGTGNNIIISNLGFSPDLIIIKGETAQYGVFRTSLMGGDSTAYLANAVANFAGGIIAINPKGFTVGTSATVNTAGVNYYWTAYGNAWDPTQNTGSSYFYIGAYYGNGIDNRSITGLPFQADMVTVKRFGATAGVFRTSAESGDTSAFFAATADAANNIQSLNSDGFQIGSSAGSVNTAANVYFYFGFKNGSSFHVDTYSGTGSSHNITTATFQPDSIWIKRSTAVQGVWRTSDMNAVSSDYAEPFANATHTTGDVTNIISNGFTVGTSSDTDASGGTYWYVAWKDNYSPTTPTFQMQTGYYTGNTNPIQITGLGFRPQLVILKSDSNSFATLFSSTAMAGPNTGYFIATADNTSGWTNLEKDGFTVSGTASSTGVRYTWIAFAGSDCSSSGMFCVGEYTGDANSTKAITTGFQPDLVWVKRSTAVDGTWRSSSMPTNYAQFFSATTQDTAGSYFTTLDSTGFTVGSTNDTSGGAFYYVAFKNTANLVNVGSYSGTGSAHGITGVGFAPDWLFVKNANAGTAVAAIYNVRESYGDNSSYFSKTANLTGGITSLDSDGFHVGTNATANGSGNTIYYAAFGGGADNSGGSGSFLMKKGSYTGTGAYLRISDLGFSPDLVIVKGETTQTGVFRTSMMGGDSTAVMDAATANITGGITAINPNGFTVGTSATVNSAGVTYYWTAYGDAWNPISNSGASDFYIGAYYANGIDSTNISRLPFQADLVVIKKSDTTAQTGVWRTSAQSGDTSAFFAATNDTANNIQSLNSDGFQIGTTVNVNTAAKLYYYFGFKEGTNFQVGTYSGNGTSKSITDVTFQPDNMWLKRSSGTATRAVSRTSDMATSGTDWAEPFTAVAHITSAITGTLSNGFSVGSAAEANASGVSYWYAAWQVPAANNPTPTLDQLLKHGQWFYNGVKQAFTF